MALASLKFTLLFYFNYFRFLKIKLIYFIINFGGILIGNIMRDEFLVLFFIPRLLII